MAAETTIQGNASPYRWWMLFLISVVAFFIAGIAWPIMPVLFQEIAQPKDVGLGLSLIQLGAIWGMMPLALALLSLAGGITADRYGVRLVIGIGAIMAAVFGACRGMSGSFTSLLIWMFLFGVGYSCIGPNIPKFVGTWFQSKDLGLANGIVFSAVGLGGGMAVQFGGTFVSSAVGGWRNTLYIIGFICLLIGMLWFITVKSTETGGAATKALHRGAGSPHNVFQGLVVGLKTADVWLLVICQMLFLGAWIGVQGYLPMYLVVKGMTKPVAHGYASIAVYFFMIGSTVVPLISDRVGTRKFVYVVTIGIAGISLMFVPFATGAALGVALAVMGFCGGGYVIPRLIPVEHPRLGLAIAGSVFGFIVSMGFLGGFISPIVGNALASKAGGESTFILWGSFMLLAAFIFLFITETHPKKAAKVSQAGSSV